MQKTNNRAMIGIIAVVIIGLILAGAIVIKSKGSSESLDKSTYKDGTYSATGSYTSPGGNEKIDVTITLSGGKITSSSVQPKAAKNESREFQAEFVDGYKQLVTGKSIASLRLSKVSGSSLTSRGFNEALDQIKSSAKN